MTRPAMSEMGALIGSQRSRAQNQTSHWRAEVGRFNGGITMITSYGLNNTFIIFNPLKANTSFHYWINFYLHMYN